MSEKHGGFSVADLRLVKAAPATAEVFALGDRVTLRSGGPVMTIVDHSSTHVVAAWRDPDGTVSEATLPAICVMAAP